MKRIFWLLAAAAITITACNKPQYIIPIDDDDEEEQQNPDDEGYKEKTFVVNITLKDGVNNTYDGTVGTMPGNEILDFFDMTAEEFYKGMGTCTTGSMESQQSDNTVLFGMAIKNSTDDLKWVPSTSNNFGHWIGKDGELVTWGDDAYFFTESLCEWGLDAPDAETLEDMWKFTVGCFPGRTSAGQTYKATEVFFVTDEDDVELYAFVQWNVTIEAAEEVNLNVVGTQTLDLTLDYDGNYLHTPINEMFDAAAIQSGIGLSYEEATVYGVNADGSFTMAPGANFWFTKEGNVGSWGSGCGIDIQNNEFPADAPVWCVCNYPDETLAGTTVTGAIAFVNPDTNNAYVVRVNVTFPGIDYLSIDVLVSYETGETEYTLSENNLAALAAALGVENVTAEEIGTTYPLKGINADGSVYDGGYTANNGYWYTLEGNVTNWAGVEAAGYVGAFIEYRGDYNFGCGLWEESGVQSTVKLGIGDAVLTFNLTVDQPKAFETTEVGTMSSEATQSLTAGYGGPTLVLDYDAVCSMLELNDENFAANFKVTATDGTVEYTGETPGGYWFNAENAICGWGDVNSAYYMNFKYGDALPEGAEGKLILMLGVRNDNSTDEDGNVTHACPAPGTYTGVVRLANIETLKHITYTLTFTVTE